MVFSRRLARRQPSIGGNSSLIFPATVTPAIWFDGRQSLFSDLAGSVPANVGDPLGFASEAAPLASNWNAQLNLMRGRRDPVAARFDYFGTGSPGQFQSLLHTSAPSVDTTNCTLLISYVARDASNGPAVGLLRAGNFGMVGGGSTTIYYNTGTATWNPGTPAHVKGDQVTRLIRYTSTALKFQQLINGALTSDTLTTAVTGNTTPGQFMIADGGGAVQGMYGSVTQALVVNRAVTDAEALSLLRWADAQPRTVAYPTSAILFGVIGDSIARNSPGATVSNAWCWKALSNIRATYPTCEMLNSAVGGTGTAIGFYTPVIPYYDAARARNVLVMASGTNDLANGNGSALVISNLNTAYDTALAAGWRPLIATILDRTGALSIAQAAFDSQRATVNAAILASGRNFIDLTGVAGVSANGASAGANFIGDGVHPGDAGHLLMEPVYRAAMLAQAA